MEPIRVLLVMPQAADPGCDDVAAFLAGQNDVHVVSTFDNLRAAELYVERNEVHVALVDLSFVSDHGPEPLKHFRDVTGLPTFVLSPFSPVQSRLLRDALDQSGAGHAPKSAGGGDREANAALVHSIRSAVGRPLSSGMPTVRPRTSRPHTQRPTTPSLAVALGSSTGGTEALLQVIPKLPLLMPPVAVVQHMPAQFTRSFAERLDARSRVSVREAEDNMRLTKGMVVLAPGDQHLRLVQRTDGIYTELSSDPPVNGHRPSVDVLFDSCAELHKVEIVAALFTGMGNDGAEGLLKLRRLGATTIAQDEHSSVVFGMPRAAIEIGAAGRVVSLANMAGTLTGACRILQSTE